MALYAPLIPARYAAPLLDYLREQQPQALESVLSAAGLDESSLSAAESSLTIEQFDALLTGMSRQLGRSDLGFELGQRISIDSHQALGLALRNCTSVDALLRLAARFSRLLTPSFFLQYRRDSQGGGLFIRPAASMSQTTLHAFEEMFAVSFHQDCTALLGRQNAVDIYLSMPEPAHIERYTRLYPTRFHFAALPLPEVRCVLSGELLDRPLLQPRQDGTGGSVSELQRQQAQFAKISGWREWVSLMLREAEGCQPSRSELAELLSVSPTTLTRNLAQEGCNLRALGNQIRHQRACAMLRESQQSIAQIAYRLGYNDPSNFSNAFQQLSGMSPRCFRQQGQGPE